MATRAKQRPWRKPILRPVPAIEGIEQRAVFPANVVDLDAWAVDRGYKDEADIQMGRARAQVVEALERLSVLSVDTT